MGNCSHCSSSISNWVTASDGTLDCTGTSASTVFRCFSNQSVFLVDQQEILYFNPTASPGVISGGPLGYDLIDVANTTTKLWTTSGGSEIIEFDLTLSPFEEGVISKPSLNFNRILTSSGITAFDALTALDNNNLVGGSGSTIYLHTFFGSGFTSQELFELPDSRILKDLFYNPNKGTLVVASMKSDLSKNYISEFTSGGILVNDFEFGIGTYAEIGGIYEFSGLTYFAALDSSFVEFYQVDVDLFNGTQVGTNPFGSPTISGFSQAVGAATSFFNYSATSYCLSTNYITTSQYDGNYTSGGTLNGQTVYAGNNGGVIYYNSATTQWCLSSYIGGPCILFGGNSCQSPNPNLSEEFFSNTICPTPTPSQTNNCSVLDFSAFFDCDIPGPSPSVTPTQTVTPSTGFIYPTPTPTLTMSPTPSGNFCANVNFCFGVENVAPSPSPTPTMTPSSAAGRNTYGGVVTFTTINGEVVCPPVQK